MLRVLQTVVQPNSSFDSSLAEYVFFPLSHVLRQSNILPQRALDLALQCLNVLLSTGWKETIPTSLGTQLLILLTFTAAGSSIVDRNATSEVSEELKTVAFDSLTGLFWSFAGSPGATALTTPANVPALAHAVTVILDGIIKGPSSTVQLSSISALNAFQECMTDKEVFAGFFPGIISALTKVLRRDIQSRRSWMVLQAGLRSFTNVLQLMLEDGVLERALRQKSTDTHSPHLKVSLTDSWLKATASQVKLALTTVVKLQDHERFEVRHALFELCRIVLERCRSSLKDCIKMMVETMVSLSWTDSESGNNTDEKTLHSMVAKNSSFIESLKSSFYAWVIALPRIIQSNDDGPKRKVIYQVSTSIRLLSDGNTDTSLINNLLITNLRDSVSAVLAGTSSKTGVIQLDSNALTIRGLEHRDNRISYAFPSALASQKSQQEVLSLLDLALKQFSGLASGPALANSLTESLWHTSGLEAVASFWITLNLAKNALHQEVRPGQSTAVSTGSGVTWMDVLEDLYSYSLSKVLPSWDNEDDWRLQCLALETVALEAQQLRLDFRNELVEALYPVLHLIGSSEKQLQTHALVCLDVIADACDYPSAGVLIIENVDYLVNAVALKFNTFDLSPQAPQVLLMMIKLAGPSLLPYLDDLVTSMFVALENFHGYPRLVELLFAVLREIVVEGSRSDILRITSTGEINHQKASYRPRSMQELATLLEKNARRRTTLHEEDHFDKEPAPRRPWKDIPRNIRDNAVPNNGQDTDPTSEPSEAADRIQEVENDSNEVDEQKPSPGPSRTYKLLLSISRLSQHYLTHESARLRRDLLELITTASPALQHDEDNFLPLVNDIWPVLVKRLYDQEPFVVAAAAEAVGSIFVAAGDFMTIRIETEWPRLKALYWQVYPAKTAAAKVFKNIHVSALPSKSALNNHRVIIKPHQAAAAARATVSKNIGNWPAERDVYTSSYQIWDSLTKLIMTMLEHVRISDEMFDDVVEMFADLLLTRSDLLECLEKRNPDAVWLVMMLRSEIKRGEEDGGMRTLSVRQDQQLGEDDGRSEQETEDNNVRGGRGRTGEERQERDHWRRVPQLDGFSFKRLPRGLVP